MTGYHYPQTRRLWQVAMAVFVADQFTKAWAVYALGKPHCAGFLPFLLQYFTWFNTGGGSAIETSCGSIGGGGGVQLLGPWLRFELLLNSGASFSLFKGNSFALSFVSFAIAWAAWWLWRRSFRTGPRIVYVFGLIIGGALGNGVDRFRLREVVDFIAVRVPYVGKLFPALGDPYDFPIFNVADACGFLGFAGLTGFLLWLVKYYLGAPRKPAAASAPSVGFRGGLQLSDEQLEDLQYLDTTVVRPMEISPAELARLQEEASRAYVERLRAETAAAELPELASDLPKLSAAVRLARYDKHIPEKKFNDPL